MSFGAEFVLVPILVAAIQAAITASAAGVAAGVAAREAAKAGESEELGVGQSVSSVEPVAAALRAGERLATNLSDPSLLDKTLDDLGLRVERGSSLAVPGTTDRVDGVLVHLNAGTVGMNWTGTAYEVVAPTTMPAPATSEFLSQVAQKYAYIATTEKLAAQGFELAEEQSDSDGRVHLKLRRVSA